MSNPEQFHGNNEQGVEARDAANERSQELLKSLESSVEASPEAQREKIESARHETEAAFSKEASSEQRGHEPSGFSRAIKRVTAQEKIAAYKETMTHIRQEMSSPTRAFSKFIHNGGVEKASDAIGKSVARPNAILSGSTSALVLVSLVYITAKIFGYPLSGFETIGAFVFGWIIGIIYDYARTMISGRAQ